MKEMTLLEWADSGRGNRALLARRMGVDEQLIGQWAKGHREIPLARKVAIENGTDGAVTRIVLSPDDWWIQWPELAEKYPERVPAHVREGLSKLADAAPAEEPARAA